MTDELLARAREQSEHSELSVRAPALLHIAHVEWSFDPDAAHRTFLRGLDAVRQMAGDDRLLFLDLVRNIAAAMDPDLLTEIPDEEGRSPFGRDHLVATMVAQGHVDAAYAFVLNSDDAAFPFMGLMNLMHVLKKEEDRVAVFRRATEAWRNRRNDSPGDLFRRIGRDHFIQIFQSHWKLLPGAEAREIAREIVRSALDGPDHPMRSGYGEGPTISSTRENSLFEIFHILQHLDPPLADSLIADHPQLAAITVRYPNGLETVMKEAEEQRKKLSKQNSDDEDGIGGDPRDSHFSARSSRLRAMAISSQPWSMRLRNTAKTPGPKIATMHPRNSGRLHRTFESFFTEPERSWERKPPTTSKWFQMTISGFSLESNLLARSRA
jgi:hypothetical protein